MADTDVAAGGGEREAAARETPPDGDDAPPPNLLASLRRAALRGGVLGLAVALVSAVLGLVLGVTESVFGGGSTPLPEVLLRTLQGSAVALLVGVPLLPVAFVEFAAASRGRDAHAAHLLASALLVPLTPLAGLVAVGQGVYATTLMRSGSFEDALGAALELVRDAVGAGPPTLLVAMALAVPVPLTTYVRLRERPHREQLGFVLAASLILGTALLCAAGRFFAPALVPIAVLAALLPGSYARADQLERRLVAWWRSRSAD